LKPYLDIKSAFLGLITVLLFGLTLYSCGPKQIFSETEKMNQNTWTYDDFVSFQTDIVDTTGIYDILFFLNHGEDYSLQNLYFTINIKYPDNVSTLDTLNINISDKMGRRIANCRGESCKLYAHLMKNIRFQQIGTHRFTFNQFTRIDSLPDIYEIGIIIEESKI